MPWFDRYGQLVVVPLANGYKNCCKVVTEMTQVGAAL